MSYADRQSLRRSERRDRPIDSPRPRHHLQPTNIDMYPRSSLYTSTGRYGTPQEKRGKVSKEARQLKETLMEYLENTVFEHQGELNVIYDRLDRMEEENRCIMIFEERDTAAYL